MNLDHPVLQAWIWFMAAAFVIAFIASMPPRRPASQWIGDFFVRWGLAGLLVWFVVNGLWAVRELMGMRVIVPISVIEAYLEYATVWGAVLTGMATFIFFGSTLLLNAIFSKQAAAEPIMIYYRQVVFAATASENKATESAESYALAKKKARRVPVSATNP